MSSPSIHPESPLRVVDPFSLDDVPDDVTIGEIDRRVTRLEMDLRERAKAADDRAARMLRDLVPREYYDDRHRALQNRVGDLEAELEEQRIAREEIARLRSTFHRNLTVAAIASGITSLGAVIAAIIANIHH